MVELVTGEKRKNAICQLNAVYAKRFLLSQNAEDARDDDGASLFLDLVVGE